MNELTNQHAKLDTVRPLTDRIDLPQVGVMYTVNYGDGLFPETFKGQLVLIRYVRYTPIYIVLRLYGSNVNRKFRWDLVRSMNPILYGPEVAR